MKLAVRLCGQLKGMTLTASSERKSNFILGDESEIDNDE